MKNYYEFKCSLGSAKAYTTLENLFRIENHGFKLPDIFFNIMYYISEGKGNFLSFSDAHKLLLVALEADMPDVKKRKKFVDIFFNERRFVGISEVNTFISEACRQPDIENDGDQPKKQEANP